MYTLLHNTLLCVRPTTVLVAVQQERCTTEGKVANVQDGTLRCITTVVQAVLKYQPRSALFADRVRTFRSPTPRLVLMGADSNRTRAKLAFSMAPPAPDYNLAVRLPARYGAS